MSAGVPGAGSRASARHPNECVSLPERERGAAGRARAVVRCADGSSVRADARLGGRGLRCAPPASAGRAQRRDAARRPPEPLGDRPAGGGEDPPPAPHGAPGDRARVHRPPGGGAAPARGGRGAVPRDRLRRPLPATELRRPHAPRRRPPDAGDPPADGGGRRGVRVHRQQPDPAGHRGLGGRSAPGARAGGGLVRRGRGGRGDVRDRGHDALRPRHAEASLHRGDRERRRAHLPLRHRGLRGPRRGDEARRLDPRAGRGARRRRRHRLARAPRPGAGPGQHARGGRGGGDATARDRPRRGRARGECRHGGSPRQPAAARAARGRSHRAARVLGRGLGGARGPDSTRPAGRRPGRLPHGHRCPRLGPRQGARQGRRPAGRARLLGGALELGGARAGDRGRAPVRRLERDPLPRGARPAPRCGGGRRRAGARQERGPGPDGGRGPGLPGGARPAGGGSCSTTAASISSRGGAQ